MAGTAMRNPGQIVTFGCDTTIAEGSVVVVSSADGHVTLPGAAPVTSGIVGLAKTAGVSGGNIDVVLNGIFAGVAAAGITRGQALVANGVTGTVRAYAVATDTFGEIVGYALESVNSGERVGMVIAPQQAPAVPKIQQGTVTLSSGVGTLSSLTLTASSQIYLQLVTKGSGTLSTWHVPSTSGNAITITAIDTSGTTVTTDVSVNNVLVIG